MPVVMTARCAHFDRFLTAGDPEGLPGVALSVEVGGARVKVLPAASIPRFQEVARVDQEGVRTLPRRYLSIQSLGATDLRVNPLDQWNLF